VEARRGPAAGPEYGGRGGLDMLRPNARPEAPAFSPTKDRVTNGARFFLRE
jgi:hypothetical protein